MKFSNIAADLARKMRVEPLVTVHIALPSSLIRQIDSTASGELLNRSAWVRRVIFNALHQDGR
jgi:metal-responsive CopG/Arc/MetJ family transcriptional regulator